MRRKMDKLLSIHRILTNAPDGMEVDHINRDSLDNRKQNLRICTKSQNQMNSGKEQLGRSSHYKGVSLYKRHNKWMSRIKKRRKEYFLGYYENEIDAAKAYDTKAKELFGEFARLNFE